MGNNMGNSIEEDPMHTRWEVLKSMLTEFPSLRSRTIRYLIENEPQNKKTSEYQLTPEIKEEIQKAIKEHKLERTKRQHR